MQPVSNLNRVVNMMLLLIILIGVNLILCAPGTAWNHQSLASKKVASGTYSQLNSVLFYLTLHEILTLYMQICTCNVAS